MHKSVHVQSEIGRLKTVIVHEPDSGISRVSPKRSDELLFDDIVFLPQMIEEHRLFVKILKILIGENNVLEVRDLLTEALEHDPGTRELITEWIVDFEELPTSYAEKFKKWDNAHLAEVMITGHDAKEDYIYFDPIPNFIFTRDIAAVINDQVIITKAAKTARYRENFLTRCIFWSHPLFSPVRQDDRIINLNYVNEFPPSRRGEPICLEGGDVMILNEDYLLIGCSERTNQHTIHTVRDVLFKKGTIKNIVQVNIPNERSFMHIDTIFTQINEHHIVAYKPIVYDGLSSYVNVYRKNGAEAFYPSIKDFFHGEIDREMEFIFSGNGISPYQEREQWTDGCNLVAIKPGVALTYDRNPRTEKAFEAAGYTILHAYDLIKGVENHTIIPEEIENTIITLPSNELARARGGSHCMTCPILRE